MTVSCRVLQCLSVCYNWTSDHPPCPPTSDVTVLRTASPMARTCATYVFHALIPRKQCKTDREIRLVGNDIC